jgi:hypothetical protein
MAIKRANVKEESMESMGKLRSNPMGKMRNPKKKKPMPKKKK